MELHCDDTVNGRGLSGAGGLTLSLFVCRSHKRLALCHYLSFTNCFYLLCIL